jgi:DNA-directed RNA polymerase subunit F
MEIIEEKPINMVELHSEIDKIKKRDENVNFRVGKIEEYLNLFQKLKPAEAKELQGDLEKLNVPRLKDMHIHKLIDIMPLTADDVKLVLEGYPITVTKASCELIAKAIEKFKK